MKSLFALLLLSLNSYAVEVRNCPAKIALNYSGFETSVTLNHVLKEMNQFGAIESEELEAIQTSWNNLSQTKNISRVFTLSAASSGSCRYKTSSDESVRIYTNSGKDILMVQTEMGPRGILLRAYAEITKMTPTWITLSKTAPGMGLAVPRYPYTSYSAGGGLYFIGSVTKFETVSK